MRQFLTVVLVGVAIWLGWRFSHYAKDKIHAPPPREMDESDRPAAGKLPGVPASLESSLEAAKREGAEGLAAWIRKHHAEIRDPRFAEIELDYVVLVGRSDQAEARRVLAGLKPRLKPTSSLYKRFQQLDRLYNPQP